MIRIGVAEDDPAGVDRLLGHLDRFQRDHGESLRISRFADGADLLHDYRPDWDVLLLDIRMERVDGMTTAQRIREVDSEVLIVFVTSSPQYAVSGYRVDALSYLLKPVSYRELEQEMLRCVQRLSRRERRQMLFSTTDGARHRVDLADILYFESSRNHVLIHTLDADLATVGTLKALEAEVEGAGFVRCNSGYLVNLRHVTGIDGATCRIRGGARLQISRPRKAEFLDALAGYIGARGTAP